jgi:hypothetical protein
MKLLTQSRSFLARTSLPAIIVLAATVLPRLMVLGGLPTTDEGFYAYFAQLIHTNLAAGRGLPDAGTLMIYPLMTSWVFGLSLNHILLLRLTDLFVAAVASWLLYRVIEYESGSRFGGALISLVVIFTMNQPVFIQCGFKNSIFAAYIPLFLAMRLGQVPTNLTHTAWWGTGILAALAVLIRETFLPFLIVGALAILMAHGWRNALRFTLGATATVLIVTGVISISRGGSNTLIASYRYAGVVYASVSAQRASLFVANGILSAKEAMVAIVLGGMGTVAILANAFIFKCPDDLKRLFFWVFVVLVPLLEPASKIGYPYSFAVCLPGLAGLAAFGWKNTLSDGVSSTEKRFAAIVTVVCVLCLCPKYIPLVGHWPATRKAMQCAGSGAWPANAIDQSNFLMASEAIRKIAPPNGTLCVSGFMYTLYPLTGLLPPSNDMSNLSATLIKLDLDERRFSQLLLASPPDILMTTTRTDWPGAEILAKVVINSGLYEPVTDILVASDRSYGKFGGTIYRRIDLGKRKRSFAAKEL